MDENSEEHVKAEKGPDSVRMNVTEHPSPWDEFPTIWPFDWEGDGEPASVWTRLGFLIPAAPWPVLIWFVLLGRQDVGRHGSEALHIVASEASALIIACAIVGAVCHVLGYRDVRTLVIALLFSIIHLYLIYGFVNAYV